MDFENSFENSFEETSFEIQENLCQTPSIRLSKYLDKFEYFKNLTQYFKIIFVYSSYESLKP